MKETRVKAEDNLETKEAHVKRFWFRNSNEKISLYNLLKNIGEKHQIQCHYQLYCINFDALLYTTDEMKLYRLTVMRQSVAL